MFSFQKKGHLPHFYEVNVLYVSWKSFCLNDEDPLQSVSGEEKENNKFIFLYYQNALLNLNRPNMIM